MKHLLKVYKFLSANSTTIQAVVVALSMVWAVWVIKGIVGPKTGEQQMIETLDSVKVVLRVIEQREASAIEDRAVIMSVLQEVYRQQAMSQDSIKKRLMAISKRYENIDRIEHFGSDSLARAYAEFR